MAWVPVKAHMAAAVVAGAWREVHEVVVAAVPEEMEAELKEEVSWGWGFREKAAARGE